MVKKKQVRVVVKVDEEFRAVLRAEAGEAGRDMGDVIMEMMERDQHLSSRLQTVRQRRQTDSHEKKGGAK